jgi:predicted aspartyl protease
MGTFRVEATFRHVHDRERKATVSLLVDTGATWTTLPRETIDALGATPIADRRVRLANGSEETWPVTILLVTLEGAELPTVCLVGPPNGPALLGAVTLEEFSLSADPVGRRLVPVSGYLMASAVDDGDAVGGDAGVGRRSADERDHRGQLASVVSGVVDDVLEQGTERS